MGGRGGAKGNQVVTRYSEALLTPAICQISDHTSHTRQGKHPGESPYTVFTWLNAEP